VGGFLFILLALASAGGVMLAFGWSDGSHAKALKRAEGFAASSKIERSRRNSQDQAGARRKQILTSLKQAEKQQRKQSLTLEARLAQAGLPVNIRGFWMISAGLGAFVFLVLLIVSHDPRIAFGGAFVAGLGLPRWALGAMSKRRIKKFTSAFPDAVDIIVRGVKSGLPVHDCLKVIAAEAPKPLNEEFAKAVESLGMGLGFDQALEKMHGRMPTSEVRFFAIVLGIQQKTGGNLAESLNNLSVVLRARKLMKEKIKAMSGEAVASAGIIGSLPVVIMILVGLTTPKYMMPLYTDPRGHILLMIGAFWMFCGVFVMRKMINFKF
jgi:tight adherence protein B